MYDSRGETPHGRNTETEGLESVESWSLSRDGEDGRSGDGGGTLVKRDSLLGLYADVLRSDPLIPRLEHTETQKA